MKTKPNTKERTHQIIRDIGDAILNSEPDISTEQLTQRLQDLVRGYRIGGGADVDAALVSLLKTKTR